jgi:hypothetical protein
VLILALLGFFLFDEIESKQHLFHEDVEDVSRVEEREQAEEDSYHLENEGKIVDLLHSLLNVSETKRSQTVDDGNDAGLRQCGIENQDLCDLWDLK